MGVSLAFSTVLGSFRKYRRGDVVSVAVALLLGTLAFFVLGNCLGIWGKPAGSTSDLFAKIHSWLQPSSLLYFAIAVAAFSGLVFLYQVVLDFVGEKFEDQRRIAILLATVVCLVVGALFKSGFAYFFPALLENASVFSVAFGGGIAVVACFGNFQ